MNLAGMFYRLLIRVLRLMFRMIAECSIRSGKKVETKLILAFCDWLMNKGYLETVTEEEVAVRLGATPQQLSSFCRTVLGKTFRQVRKEYRVREAKYLLKTNPELPLEILGECVGIPDKSNLRKQFIEVVGCSPREWLSRRRASDARRQ